MNQQKSPFLQIGTGKTFAAARPYWSCCSTSTHGMSALSAAAATEERHATRSASYIVKNLTGTKKE